MGRAGRERAGQDRAGQDRAGHTGTHTRRAFLAGGLGTALLAALAACSTGDDLSRQAQAGDDKGFIAGDGTVTQIAPGRRGAGVDFRSTTTAGRPVDLAGWRGDVVVLNFWYAACAPCRAEAPALERVAGDYAARSVHFLGVNVSDEKDTAEAFMRTFHVSYPSVLDTDGQVLLAVRGQVPPQAVPTTLVLDRAGRPAARVLGRTDAATLSGLIDDVLAEAGS